MAQELAHAGDAERQPPTDTGRDLVLLVGGTTDEQELYEAGLVLCGFEVRWIDELKDMRAAVDAHRPRVVILILELDGMEVWRELEALQCGEAIGVPGILLTAWVRQDGANRERARQAGCAAFVAKPCTHETLASVVHAVLAGCRGLTITTSRGVRTLDAAAPDRLSEESLFGLMRAEYQEMPGLRVTAEQASRLWGADPVTCESVLQRLVGEQVLRRTRDGAYVRAS